MACYACRRDALHICPRCERHYCDQHGAQICAVCASPASAFPSGLLYRTTVVASAALVVLAAAYVVAWPDAPSGRPRSLFAGGQAAVPRPGMPLDAGPEPAAEPSPTPAPPRSYTVIAGDTLLAIADRFGTTVDELMRLNGLTDAAKLALGQQLVVEAPKAAPAAPSVEAAPPPPAPQRKYTVTAGDTLLAIAGRFGLTVDDLLRLNGLTDPGRLSLGQELVLDPAQPAATGTGASPQPATPAPTATPAPPRTYTVVAGDTLLGIALRNGTTVDALLRLNGLTDAARLSLGQEITLPN